MNEVLVWLGEHQLLLEFNITSRGAPEVRHLKNGDPGRPAEPMEFEVIRVYLCRGREQRLIELDHIDLVGMFYDNMKSSLEVT